MKHVVLEIQTNPDGTVGTLVSSFDGRLEAESAYHSVLAAAAISDLPCHTAVLLTSDGEQWRAEHYEHETEE